MRQLTILEHRAHTALKDIGYPTVPIWVSFLGGLGGLIGANFDLNLAVMLAAYTDSMTSSSQRSTWFFITTSMQYVGQVAFPLAAGKAINLDGQGGTSEVSLSISLGMAVAGLIISLFLWPETMKNEKTQDSSTGNEHQDGIDPNETSESKSLSALSSLADKFSSFWTNFQHSVQTIGAGNIWLLAFSMFLITTAIKAVDWLGLIQYPVIKFGWKYNQV